ncbi:nitrile-specifier protein 5-like isoform X2 [Gigantopelta aegis]|uniref:nitrile-specifier protein 5-like isoform X2 n=1 Tax=Gigantopelta aegis TaxID=1735272 RepID=UPI001B888A17|nr:nitrile-specifier protein 5-like isoform X2 [Gigantopelta aegis]
MSKRLKIDQKKREKRRHPSTKIHIGYWVSQKFSRIVASGAIPFERSGHSLEVIGDKVYVFGGEHTPRVPVGNTINCLDLEVKHWSKVLPDGTPPIPRTGSSSTTIGIRLYIFGGRTGLQLGGTVLNDLHVLDLKANTWHQVRTNGNPPLPRYLHSMIAIGNTIYVFGGCSEFGRLNDLYSFDTVSNTWTKLATSNEIKGRTGAGFLAIDDSVYVIGGLCGGKNLQDMFRFDVQSGQWAVVDAHPPLPSLAFFGVSAIGKNIFVFFGQTDQSSQSNNGLSEFTRDVYVYNTETGGGWTKVSLGGEIIPPARGWFPAATCGQRIVLFGGQGLDHGKLDDTYVFSRV